MSEDERRASLFALFNEIGIIQQLAATAFNRRLPDGLHVSHFAVINHLCRLGDGKTPVEIARAFQTTKANMTNTLSKLAERGLVVFAAHPTDGRSKTVQLTEAGRAFRDRAVEPLYPMLDGLAARLDTDRLLAILPVLADLRADLDSHRDG